MGAPQQIRADRPTAQPGWSPFEPPGGAETGRVAARPLTGTHTVRRGRPGVIVGIVAFVELVIIAGGANQFVTKTLVRFTADHQGTFLGHFVSALTVFSWRVSPQAGDRANEPLGHALLDLTVIVLSALLVLAVCRGPVTFARAFFGTWTAVLAATFVGVVVLYLVSPLAPLPAGYDRVGAALFAGVDGFVLVAGLSLGLVIAIFAAIFAVATRRTVREMVTAEGLDERDLARTPDRTGAVDAGVEPPPPYYGSDDRSGRAPAAAAATTAVISGQEARWSGDSPASSSGADRTSEFPAIKDPIRDDSAPAVATTEKAAEPTGDSRDRPLPPTSIGSEPSVASTTFDETAGTGPAADDTTQLPRVTDDAYGGSTTDEPVNSPDRSTTVNEVDEEDSAPVGAHADGGEANDDVHRSDDTSWPPRHALPPFTTPSVPATSDSSTTSEGATSSTPQVAQSPWPPRSESDPAATRAFPRPPDDEDLGQQPDHHDL